MDLQNTIRHTTIKPVESVSIQKRARGESQLAVQIETNCHINKRLRKKKAWSQKREHQNMMAERILNCAKLEEVKT